jgi:hypothetical protein
MRRGSAYIGLEPVMTAQIPDRLIHRGRELDLCTLPLQDYLKRLPKARRPKFRPGSTANWRGYVAIWQIIDGRLFLTAIEDSVVEVDGRVEEANLATIFPHRSAPVAATWVTDDLRCPEGRLRSYVHAGFASEYERDRILAIEKGVLLEEWLVYNPPAPLHYLIAPDGSRTYATTLGSMALAPDQDPFPVDTPVEPWRLWGDPDWDVCVSSDAEDQEGYFVGALTRLDRSR